MGNIEPFEIVPFVNGDDPTGPPVSYCFPFMLTNMLESVISTICHPYTMCVTLITYNQQT